MKKFQEFCKIENTTSYNEFIRACVRAKWPSDAQKEWWYTKLSNSRRLKLLQVSEAQNHHCCYCGVKTWHPSYNEIGSRKTLATLEHVKCRAHGGTDSNMNLAMACHSCNNLRADHDADWFYDISQMPGSTHANMRLALGMTPMVERQRSEEKLAASAARHNAMVLTLGWYFLVDNHASDSIDDFLNMEMLEAA